MTEFVGIIPARYRSSRFPGKVLCDLHGQPMIKWVYDSVMEWPHWRGVYVATEDQPVSDACKQWGIPCLMTRDDHLDCLDRAAEVVDICEKNGDGADKYIIVQGDEPLFNVNTLNVDLSPPIVNFYTDVTEDDEIVGESAANAVKVVISKSERALYYSRFTLPYHNAKTRRNADPARLLKQLGVYVFTGDRLKQYTHLGPSHLECMEGIGLNRLLENDIDIHMRYTEYDSVSVDTEADRQRMLKLIATRNPAPINGRDGVD